MRIPSLRAPSRTLTLLGWILVTAAGADPVAMVTDITGSAARRARQQDVVDLVIGMEVDKGDALRIADGECTVSLLYPDGGMLRAEVRPGSDFLIPEQAASAAPGLFSRLGAGLRGLFSDRSDSKARETGSMNLGMALARLPARELKKEARPGNEAPGKDDSIGGKLFEKDNRPKSPTIEAAESDSEGGGGSIGGSDSDRNESSLQETTQAQESLLTDEPPGTRARPDNGPGIVGPAMPGTAMPATEQLAESDPDLEETQILGPKGQLAVASEEGTRRRPPTGKAIQVRSSGNVMLAMFSTDGADRPAGTTTATEYRRTWSIPGMPSETAWDSQLDLEPGKDYELHVTEVTSGDRHTVTLRLPDDTAVRSELETLSRDLENKPTDELFALGISLMNQGYLMLARRCLELTLARFQERKLPEKALDSVRRPLETIQMVVGKEESTGARD